MSTNTELATRFDNALGQMSKEINNIFPEGTGYVRIVPLNSATAGGLSIQINNLWSIEIGYLEDEVFDSDHRYILRIEEIGAAGEFDKGYFFPLLILLPGGVLVPVACIKLRPTTA